MQLFCFVLPHFFSQNFTYLTASRSPGSGTLIETTPSIPSWQISERKPASRRFVAPWVLISNRTFCDNSHQRTNDTSEPSILYPNLL
ncbi:hypothetical protein BDW72DRAFT_12013 [Aspergillus terricola var. indicus]